MPICQLERAGLNPTNGAPFLPSRLFPPPACSNTQGNSVQPLTCASDRMAASSSPSRPRITHSRQRRHSSSACAAGRRGSRVRLGLARPPK